MSKFNNRIDSIRNACFELEEVYETFESTIMSYQDEIKELEEENQTLKDQLEELASRGIYPDSK